jgi:hypothetical protein
MDRPAGRNGGKMIHKNWQELIKPTQLDIRSGGDPARARRRWSPNRSSAASA